MYALEVSSGVCEPKNPQMRKKIISIYHFSTRIKLNIFCLSFKLLTISCVLQPDLCQFCSGAKVVGFRTRRLTSDCSRLNSHLYLITASKYAAWICSLSLSLMGLLASKSALVSVLKTKHEKATCTHLTSQEYDFVDFNSLPKLIGTKSMQAVI